MVHFRVAEGGSAYRAYVVRRAPAQVRGLRLVFPGRGRTFPIDESGAADLTGLDRDDLAQGKVEIDLLPLETAGDDV